jgi:hypothetical protein
MANDTTEKSVPMAGGGGANAALPVTVPVAPAATKPGYFDSKEYGTG